MKCFTIWLDFSYFIFPVFTVGFDVFFVDFFYSLTSPDSLKNRGLLLGIPALLRWNSRLIR